MVNLDELIRQGQDLQPLPVSTVRLAALVASSRTDLEEICDVIAYDQALTLALLRAANSARDAGVSEVAQVHEAVFRLGGARVLALAMSASTRCLLQRGIASYGLNEGDLWRHSVAAASAAETVAGFASETLPPETFTAALLHDVGKLVMGRFLDPFDMEMIQRAKTEGGLDPLSAERQVLGVHHGELGGIVAQHWKLPEKIVKGIIYHHTPAEGLDVICDAVYAANLLAKRMENPSLPEVSLDSDVLDRLGLAASEMGKMFRFALEHFESVTNRYTN
jgi:putative nucleotidyltransferase with HDIG domain